MLPKVCRINHKNTLFRHFETVYRLADDILDIFCNYFNVIKGVFSFSGTRLTQNFYLV